MRQKKGNFGQDDDFRKLAENIKTDETAGRKGRHADREIQRKKTQG